MAEIKEAVKIGGIKDYFKKIKEAKKLRDQEVNADGGLPV